MRIRSEFIVFGGSVGIIVVILMCLFIILKGIFKNYFVVILGKTYKVEYVRTLGWEGGG